MQTDMSTSVRHYSLYAMASEAVAEAEQVRHAAFLKWEQERSHANYEKFLQADDAWKAAERNLEQVRLLKKHYQH